MTINAVLRRLRESKGFSQQNVADELDVNVTSIGRWETNGEAIKSSVLKKLAAIYNVKLSDLYTYEQEPSIFEEPLEFYRNNKRKLSLVIDLDGTDETLNYWLSTIKKMNAAI